MTEKNKQIIDLVEKEYSLNVISNEVGLSNKQVHSRIVSLNRIGMNFERKFFLNGDVTYKLVKKLPKKSNDNEVSIYTSHTDIVFRAMVISDLHFGNKNARLDAIAEIYNYCKLNNIHIILNAGDLIDGTYGSTKATYEDVSSQIDFMFRKHPFDKRILNFILLGNHDFSTLKNLGIDMNDFLNNRRPDLISLGYGRGIVNVKNEQLILKHYVPTYKQDADDTGKIIFLGHNHEVPKLKTTENYCYSVGSLSNFSGKGKIPPTAVDISLVFCNGYFKDAIYKQLFYMNKKLVKIFETQQYVGTGKQFATTEIPNLESEYPSKVKKLEK